MGRNMELNLEELLQDARIEYWKDEDILCVAFGNAMTSNIGEWLMEGSYEIPPIGILTELDDKTPVGLWIFGWKSYWENHIESLPLPLQKKIKEWNS